MEPEGAPTKVQVVYYLSRAGQLQQPHLIDVKISPRSNGLYLRDVKRKLTAIRGPGVADSFAWSCKRNYKENYIWQDLTDDDKILPLGDGEFVLKGSALYAGCRPPGKNESDAQVSVDSSSSNPKRDPPTVRVSCKPDSSKKFDFDAVKKSVDLHGEHLQDQNELAAALTLSLQLMSNPHAHLRRFSRDKSMDLNQQVMTSLSQAKAGPAEERTLDHYDLSSNETFLSEESATRNLGGNGLPKERSKSTTSSSRTDLNYELPASKQRGSKEHPIGSAKATNGGSNGRNDAGPGTGRREKPDELPSVKTKTKVSFGNETIESTSFMLSPRRIMAVLSTPERRFGKFLHSSSLKSSTLSNSTSTNSVEPLTAIKLSKQATCLSQLRFCNQLSQEATDSRPDSPVRQSSISILVHSSGHAVPQSSNVRSHAGPSWARWKAARKIRASLSKVATDEPVESPAPTPTKADPALPEDKTKAIRQVLRNSFEFDRPVDAGSSGPGTPSLHTRHPSTENCQPPLLSRKTTVPTNADNPSAFSAVNPTSTLEALTPISVKEVITEQLPDHPIMPDDARNCSGDRNALEKDASTPAHSIADGGQYSSIDIASLPRVSISDSISAVRTPATSMSGRPESPESPLKSNPPCSPVRTNSPTRNRSPARIISSPKSFSRRTEDGIARARGLVKEVAPKDSRFKDLTKELDVNGSKATSGALRSIANSKRVSSFKPGTTTTVGAQPVSKGFNTSPPRISATLWEDPPHTLRKTSSVAD